MLAKHRYSLSDLFAGWQINLSLQAATIHQLTCCWLRAIQEITTLMSLLSWFCSLWFMFAPPYSQAGNTRLYPWSSDTCCSTAALLSVNNMLQMPQEISAIIRVNKDWRSVREKKKKKSLLLGIWRRGVCIGRWHFSREEIPSWVMLWALQEKLTSLQQHTACQDTHCFHSTKCSFPSRLKHVLNTMSLQH